MLVDHVVDSENQKCLGHMWCPFTVAAQFCHKQKACWLFLDHLVREWLVSSYRRCHTSHLLIGPCCVPGRMWNGSAGSQLFVKCLSLNPLPGVPLLATSVALAGRAGGTTQALTRHPLWNPFISELISLPLVLLTAAWAGREAVSVDDSLHCWKCWVNWGLWSLVSPAL